MHTPKEKNQDIKYKMQGVSNSHQKHKTIPKTRISKLNLPTISPIQPRFHLILLLLNPPPPRNRTPLPPLPDIVITLHIPPPITQVLIEAFPKLRVFRHNMNMNSTCSRIPEV